MAGRSLEPHALRMSCRSTLSALPSCSPKCSRRDARVERRVRGLSRMSRVGHRNGGRISTEVCASRSSSGPKGIEAEVPKAHRGADRPNKLGGFLLAGLAGFQAARLAFALPLAHTLAKDAQTTLVICLIITVVRLSACDATVPLLPPTRSDTRASRSPARTSTPATQHECGHFIAARIQNIHVSAFSVGFGPKILSYTDGAVEYSLRLFPLGGFVAFPDENTLAPQDANDGKGPRGMRAEEGEASLVEAFAPDDPDLLANRPAADRFWVISAGVLANLGFAFGILWCQCMSPGLVETTYAPGVRVPEIQVASVAAMSGVKEGDVITAVDGKAVGAGEASVSEVVDIIKRSAGRDVRMTLEREIEGKGRGRIDVVSSPAMTRRRARALHSPPHAFPTRPPCCLRHTLLRSASPLLHTPQPS